jgi:hypothetical protein
LALLDEVKRVENENREIKRPLNLDLTTNPQEPYFLQPNHNSHHRPINIFAFEQKTLPIAQ